MLVRLAMDAQAMTRLYLSEHALLLPLVSVGAWFAVGAVIGAFHFVTLRWNVSMFAARQSLLLPLGVQLVRFALMAVLLAVVARYFGALPLLVAAFGILATRTIVVRRELRP